MRVGLIMILVVATGAAAAPQEYSVTAAEVGTAPTVTLTPIVQGRGLGLLLAKAL